MAFASIIIPATLLGHDLGINHCIGNIGTRDPVVDIEKFPGRANGGFGI